MIKLLLSPELSLSFIGELTPHEAVQLLQVCRDARHGVLPLRITLAFALTRECVAPTGGGLSMLSWSKLLHACVAAIAADGLKASVLAHSVTCFCTVEEDYDECIVKVVPAHCVRPVLQLAWKCAQFYSSNSDQQALSPKGLLIHWVGTTTPSESATRVLPNVAAVLSMSACIGAREGAQSINDFEARGLLALLGGLFAVFTITFRHPHIAYIHCDPGDIRGAVVVGRELCKVLHSASLYFPVWSMDGERLSWELTAEHSKLQRVESDDCDCFSLLDDVINLCKSCRAYKPSSMHMLLEDMLARGDSAQGAETSYPSVGLKNPVHEIHSRRSCHVAPAVF